MLGGIVGFALRNRTIVLVLAAVLFFGGLYTTWHAPMDVFPEFATPQVTVETEAPGLTAEEVEALVTLRLERAVSGAPGLKTFRSVSMPGVSSITAIFADGTDVYRDRQAVSERIASAARDLPAGVVPPEIVPLTSASSTIAILGITSDGTFDPIEARSFADWVVKPRILAVPGIAKVVVYGGGVAQDQIVVSPSALRDHGLTLREIQDAARNATALGPAGAVETHGQRLTISASAQAQRVEDLRNAVVAWRGGTALTLSQVADVRVGSEFPIGDASVNGRPAVVLLVARQPDVNTLDVTSGLDAVLDDLARHLPGRLRLQRDLFRQASFIERALANLKRALLIGGVLVIVVLLVFLLDVRTALISLAAIPLSLLTALVVLRALGATVNTMTLGGLAIALGEVVDDAIIDVENIHRRLRENRERADPRPARDVILEASLEVRSSVVYATFLVALVFLPVFFLSGIAGRIFSPLAQAYVLSTLASLGVALLVVPAASSLVLAGSSAERKEGRLSRVLKRGYGALLPGSLRHPRILAASAIALTLLSLGALPFLAGKFFPQFQEDGFIVHMTGLPGTSLAQSVAVGKVVQERISKVPGVLSVAQRAGRAELADEVSGPESSEIDVRLSEDVDVARTTRRIREALKEVPGFVFGVSQFFTERLEEVEGGEPAPVVVSASGPDLDRLRDIGAEVSRVMASIPGARDIRADQQAKVPQISVRFDRARAAQVGGTMQGLQDAVTTAFHGLEVASVFEGQRIVPVVVKYPDESRDDLESIRNLPVRAAAGIVPLKAVADVAIQDVPNLISRQNGSRRLVVTCDTTGSAGSFSRELGRRLRSMPLPSGYSLQLSGDYAAQQRSIRELVLIGMMALVGVFLLLFTDFRSARLAGLVFTGLPLAVVGGIAAAGITRTPLSLGAVVGFVTLFGITARNAIMLLSHYRHLEQVEGAPFGPDLVARGSVDRLVPILMTALVTGLALIPLVAGGSRAGQEIEHPMAVVIAGGLFSSTCLTLLLLPSFYLRWGRGRSVGREEGDMANGKSF